MRQQAWIRDEAAKLGITADEFNRRRKCVKSKRSYMKSKGDHDFAMIRLIKQREYTARTKDVRVARVCSECGGTYACAPRSTGTTCSVPCTVKKRALTRLRKKAVA